MGNLRSNWTGWGIALSLWCAVMAVVAIPPRVANTSLNFPASAPASGYSLVNAFPGVAFSEPVVITAPPGETNRLFIVERRGLIWVIPDLTNPTNKQVFLDLRTNLVDSFGEAGLLGLAFHPGYASNRTFFVYRTVSTNTEPGGLLGMHDELSRFEASPTNANEALRESETRILTQYDDNIMHNAGDLKFGPDGYLYLAIGDESLPLAEVTDNKQPIDKGWFGTIIRIDVDKRPGNLPPNPRPGVTTNYAVPSDNPFVGITNYQGWAVDPAKVRTEIFANGFRNPWRIAFDPLNGNLYAGDVGTALREEINLVEKGGNYGWPFFEGDLQFLDLTNAQPPQFSASLPVYSYRHSLENANGNCVIGGLVYRGSRLAGLDGAYLFGDFVSGNIWALRHDPVTGTNVQWIAGLHTLSTFGYDPRDGGVLLADLQHGRIMRLVSDAESGAPAAPLLLSDTGAFADLATLTPAAGMVPFEVNLTFWSDHALKQRWFSVPNPADHIGFDATNSWSFPAGTVWVKHFDMEMTNGVPESRRRLETRFLVASTNGHYGLTYRWTDPPTNAVLVPADGLNETLVVDEGGGILRTQLWNYPGRFQCLSCHNPKAGTPLSFNTAQLNRDMNYGYGPTNQLAALTAAGYFASNPPSPSSLHALSTPHDPAYPLQHRARSYLQANCSSCHQPETPFSIEFLGWDARLTTPLTQARLLNGRVLAAHDPARSYLLTRIGANPPEKMPPLGTAVVDTNGIDIVTRWITSLPLPPWTNSDVGLPTLEGATAQDAWGFTVSSAGGSLSGTNDHFQFVRQQVSGSGQIRARLVGVSNAAPGSLAGVMVRQSSAADSAHVFLGVGDGWLRLIVRTNTCQPATETILGSITLPVWLRLVRDSTTVAAQTSSDGTNWTSLASVTFATGYSWEAGLAVAGGTGMQFANARFESVTVIGLKWLDPESATALNLPADLPLAVTPTAGAAQITRVEFLVDGQPIGSVTNAPYEFTWTNVLAGSHELRARAYDVAGGFTESSARWITADGPPASAVFFATNSVVAGNWPGTLGQQGAAVAGDATNLPAVVSLVWSNASTVIWQPATTDPRAMRQVFATERIASAWTSTSNLSFTVNLLDGQRRDVALYFLDWAGGGATVINVAVKDAISGALLDQRQVNQFAGGLYLEWNLRGAVRFEVTAPVGVPVLSGILIDANSNVLPTVEIVSPGPGLSLIAPATISVQVQATDPVYPVTNLELFVGDEVVAGCSNSTGTFVITNLPAGEHILAAVATDQLGDSGKSAPLVVTVLPPPARATFHAYDDTTQGNWIGAYGSQGYVLFGHATNAMPSLGITPLNGFLFVSSQNSLLPGALQRLDNTNRFAAEWVEGNQHLIDFNLKDGFDHLVAIYFHDNGGVYRESSVQMLDAVSGAVLDSRPIANFPNGKYAVWRARGHLRAAINRVLGGNVVISAVFVDAAPTPFAYWKQRHFGGAQLADGAISGDHADPDGDGRSNFVEFLLNSDPLEYSPGTEADLQGQHLQMTYTRSKDAVSWILEPQYSTNLVDWLSGTNWIEPIAIVDGPDHETITVRARRSVNEDGAGYLRLRVQPVP